MLSYILWIKKVVDENIESYLFEQNKKKVWKLLYIATKKDSFSPKTPIL